MKNSMFFKKLFWMKNIFCSEIFCMKLEKYLKSNYSESARAGLAAWVNKAKITSGTEADDQCQRCAKMHSVIFNWALNKY